MTTINNRRMTVDRDEGLVVFIIGMRINRPWKVRSWFPVFAAMPRMLRELSKNPDSGFLGAEQKISPRSPMLVQYWRSHEDLQRYARSKDNEHYPAWVAFNKRVASNGDVGIWHETYIVEPGSFEVVYNNMPAYGLGKVGPLIPASGRLASAPGRMGKTDGSDSPVDPRGEQATAARS